MTAARRPAVVRVVEAWTRGGVRNPRCGEKGERARGERGARN